jgi:uncharacterized membrane protein HdeD (DUF308 family)
MEQSYVDEATADAAKHWWWFIVAGILWILFAWVVLSFDYTTVWAVAVFFGIGLIGGGLMTIIVGLDATSWRWLHITFGVISVIAGFITLIWPGQTFLVLAAIVGWYVMIVGILDLVTAIATKEENDMWWLQLIVGIAQVLIGFWAVGYAGRSIALLVIWVGATALARGISSLVVGFGLHKVGKQLRQQMGSQPPAGFGSPPMPPPAAAV